MQQRESGPKYIGKPITIAVVRQWIIKQNLTEADTVLLHPDNFDAIKAEYRTTYGTRLPDPYFLLGALVDGADTVNEVPVDRVTVLFDDNRQRRILIAESFSFLEDEGDIIYRCRYCRSIVSRQGQVLSKEKRMQLIDFIKLRRENDKVVEIAGRCCPAGAG